VASTIDFFKAARQETLQKTKQKRLLQTGSLVALVAYCLATAAIFAYWLFLNEANQELEKRISLKKQQVLEFKQVESLQLLLKQRLGFLQKVLVELSPDYHDALLFLKAITPEGLTITGYQLSVDGQVNLEIEAINSQIVDDFVTKLKRSSEADKFFEEIFLGSLARQEESSYRLSLKIARR